MPTGKAGVALGQAIMPRTGQARFGDIADALAADDHTNALAKARALWKNLIDDGYESAALDLATALLNHIDPDVEMDPFEVWRTFSSLGESRQALMIVRAEQLHFGCSMEGWQQFLEAAEGKLSGLEKALAHAELAVCICDEYLDGFADMSLLDALQATNWNLDRSVAARPLETTFERIFERVRRMGGRPYDILKTWHKHFPENETALYELVTEARLAREPESAGKYLDALRKLVGTSPRIEAVEPFVWIEQALALHGKHQKPKALAMIEAIDARSPVVGIARDCALRVMRKGNSAARRDLGAALAARKLPQVVYFCYACIQPNADKRSLPKDVCKQFSEPDMALNSLITLSGIPDPVWTLDRHPHVWRDLAAILRDAQAPSPRLLEGLEALRRQDTSFGRYMTGGLAMGLTSNGIRRDDASLASFLAFRALVYHGAWATSDWSVPACDSNLATRARAVLGVAEWVRRQRGGDTHRIETTAIAIEYGAYRDDIRESQTTRYEAFLASERVTDTIPRERAQRTHPRRSVFDTDDNGSPFGALAKTLQKLAEQGLDWEAALEDMLDSDGPWDDEDVVEVVASHGDNLLGGDDIDELLFQYLHKQLGSEDDEEPPALSEVGRNRLLRAAEDAKIRLSDDFYTRVVEVGVDLRDEAPGQEAVQVTIFEGEDRDARNNILIGRFRIEGLDEDADEGSVILLHMNLDLDGILRVTATEKATGFSKDIVIERSLQRLDGDALAASRTQIAELFGEEDLPATAALSGLDTDPLRPAAHSEDNPHDDERSELSKARVMRRRLEARMAAMDQVDSEDAEELLSRLKAALEEENHDDLTHVTNDIEDLLFYVDSGS